MQNFPKYRDGRNWKCIEKYRSNDLPCLYSCVAYWYQEAGTQDLYETVNADERIDYYIMPGPDYPEIIDSIREMARLHAESVIPVEDQLVKIIK